MTDEIASIGHNSNAGKDLAAQIDKIERIEADKAELSADIRDVPVSLKGQGFNPKIVRKIIRIRKMDKAAREEEEALTETYLHPLGML